jgi:hypothetical protein
VKSVLMSRRDPVTTIQRTSSVQRPDLWRKSIALLAVSILLNWAGQTPLRAQADRKPAQTLPTDLALVPPNTTLFIYARTAEGWSSMRQQLGGKISDRLVDDLEKQTGLSAMQIERSVIALRFPDGIDKPPVNLMVLTTTKEYDRAKLLNALGPQAEERMHKGKSYYVVPDSRKPAVALLDERTILWADPPRMPEVLEGPSQGKLPERLKAALHLAASGKHQSVFAVDTAALAKDLVKQLPPLAKELQPLLQVQFVTCTLDVAKDVKTEAVLSFAGPDPARDAAKAVRPGLEMARQFLLHAVQTLPRTHREAPELVQLLKDVEIAFQKVVVQPQGATVKVTLRMQPDLPALGRFMDRTMLEADHRLQNTSNLKELMLAMANYEGQHGSFPPAAIYSKDGKPLLSWRVALLPYLGQEELYKQFKLDEPWDSPHNQKLLARMPAVFAHPQATPKKPHSTYYRVFVGKETIFTGSPKGVRRADITDGTVTTLAIVEAAEAVPWTKPEELPFAADQPLPKMGGHFTDGFGAAFAEGSVYFLRTNVSEKTLRAWITRAGGEKVDPP